jgi:hypothetical protein
MQNTSFPQHNMAKISRNCKEKREQNIKNTCGNGEAITVKNAKIENWRYLLDKIRTYFEQNPDADF